MSPSSRKKPTDGIRPRADADMPTPETTSRKARIFWRSGAQAEQQNPTDQQAAQASKPPSLLQRLGAFARPVPAPEKNPEQSPAPLSQDPLTPQPKKKPPTALLPPAEPPPQPPPRSKPAAAPILDSGSAMIEPASGAKERSDAWLLKPKNPPPPLPGAIARLRVPGSRVVWWGITSGLLAALALTILLSTVFARITITLRPRVSARQLLETRVTFDIKTSRIATGDQPVIPAELLQFTKTVSEEWEGGEERSVEDPSRGRAKIYNRYSARAQSLVARTRFLTDAGILFRIQKPIVIPGAKQEGGKLIPQFIEVELVADQPGPESNLAGEITLRIPGFEKTTKYEGFYAVASDGFSGGFRGVTRVPSSDDKQRAEEQITKKVYDAMRAEIEARIPAGFVVPDGFREIEITNVDASKIASAGNKRLAEASARGSAIVFRKEDVFTLLQEMTRKEDPTLEIVEDKTHPEYRIRKTDFQIGKIEATIEGAVTVKKIIPVGELATRIAGAKEGELIEILKARDDLVFTRAVLFPPWRFSAPSDPKKIHFVIEE